ncbi:MAG: MFS transporter [Bacteroidales bacterium]|jgi:MFS family permease|nr:MFS transporter [Bacteroidales bacterium]NPV35694.1 MFS transporter [Bacteroidales bacterium]
MKTRGKILVILFFGVFLGALDISIAGPALAAIATDIHIPENQLSLIFTLYILSNLVGLPLLGRLSDVTGRRLVFRTGLGIFILGSLITGSAEASLQLFIGRSLQGLGAAGIFPVATAVIGDIFPPDRRGRALGTIGAVFGIAFMFGPPFAALILKYFSWHYLFLLNVPVALLIFVGSYMLPGKIPQKKSSLNISGIFLMALFLVLFTLTFTYSRLQWPFDRETKFEISDLYPFATLLSFLILSWHEKRADNPVLNIQFLRIRQVLLAGLLAVGLGLSQSVFVFIPRITVDYFDVPVWKAGLMLMPAILGSAIASPLAGRLIDSQGSKIVIKTGLILASAGFIIFGLWGENLYLFYFSGILIGVGLAIRPGLNYIILNEAGATYRATAQGVLTVYVSMGQIAGTAFIGNAMATNQRGNYAFLLFGVLIAILALISFFLKKHTQEAFSEEQSTGPGEK